MSASQTPVEADRLRRFPLVFVDDLNFPHLADSDLSHLVRSLRFQPGDALNVSDGRGKWVPATLGSVDGDLTLDGPVVQEINPTLITIGFTPTKGVKPEWIVQKLVELGVDRVVMLSSARSVVHYDSQRTERILRRAVTTIREAAQQCRQPRLPSIEGVSTVAEFVAQQPTPLLAEPGAPALLDQVFPVSEPLSVAIGPEGGWSAEEVGLAPNVALPGRILRAETAVLAAGVTLAALRDGHRV